jgi:hypothetical protein
MADQGIKKVRIPKNQLPPVGDDNEHLIRYRVVSDDKNRASHWSPIFVVPAEDTQQVDGELIYTGGILIAVWGDELDRPSYDVFVKFDGGEYSYHGTSSTHTYTFLNTGTTSARVAIQVEGINKTRNAALTIFESSVVSVV